AGAQALIKQEGVQIKKAGAKKRIPQNARALKVKTKDEPRSQAGRGTRSRNS
ncbi:MAG: hypothetical protein UX85_C0001G0288, partial [Candidatus Beckwithbacteria bacterium GW2011_GWB1_47_15]